MSKFLLLLAFLSSSCFADPWTSEDTYRQTAFFILDAADWAQTRNIARNPDKWTETNPLLGAHPSVRQVDWYFVSASLMHFGIAYLLPSKYRSSFQMLSIGVELGAVSRNFRIGVRF
jgi:hypothetical protein